MAKKSDPEQYPAADFGRRLRAARDAVGKTQAAVAAAADMKPQTYADLERGRFWPRADTLLRLNRVLPIFSEVIGDCEK